MTTTDDSADMLVLRRLLPVPREQVFAAWLDPASLAQWMRPGDMTDATVEVDPRIGGKFRIVMVGQRDYEHQGEYLAIEPPSRLSFTWVSAATNHLPTVVSIELLESGTGTELILTHRRLPAANVEAHRQGWTDILRKLSLLTSGRAPADAPRSRP
jgi:uncharacterized protein YndB with AHSA1/START domain